MITVITYNSLIDSNSEIALHALSDAIDRMEHHERIALRQALEQSGCKKLIKNLYYDYKAQVWIDAENASRNLNKLTT